MIMIDLCKYLSVIDVRPHDTSSLHELNLSRNKDYRFPAILGSNSSSFDTISFILNTTVNFAIVAC